MKEFKGKKILKTFDMPGWFIRDIIDSYNEMLEYHELDFTLRNLTDSETDRLHEFVKDNLPMTKAMKFGQYLSEIIDLTWTKFRLLTPDALGEDKLSMDVDNNKIYSMEDDRSELGSFTDFLKHMLDKH